MSVSDQSRDYLVRRNLGAASLTCLTAFIGIWAIAYPYFHAVDYPAWRADWSLVTQCLSTSARPCGSVSKFPLAYLVNSFLAGNAQSVLSLINLSALAATALYLAFSPGATRGIPLAAIFLASIFFSPIPAFYVYTGALELQAGLVSGIYLAAFHSIFLADRDKSIKFQIVCLAVTGVFLPFYKDTMAPVMAIAMGLILAHRIFVVEGLKHWSAARMTSLVLWTAVPVIAGGMLVIAYNHVKYASILPVAYLQEAADTSPPALKSIEYFIGGLLSPSGGVLAFWSLSFAVVLFGGRILRLTPSRDAIILSADMILLSLAVFATWWAPFGWIAWGDRLMIQPAVASIILVVSSMRPRKPVSESSAASNGKTLFKILLAAPIIAYSLYYWLVPFQLGRDEAIIASINAGTKCENMREQMIREIPLIGDRAFVRTESAYQCVRERMLFVPKMNFTN